MSGQTAISGQKAVSKQTQGTSEKTTEVTLIRAHKHAGEQHPVGAKIHVTPQQKAWLEKHQIIGGSSQAAPTTTEEK